jgi:plastocyanin
MRNVFKTITPTLTICAVALTCAAALLALPADAPSTVRTPAEGQSGSVSASSGSVELVIESFSFTAPIVEPGALIEVVNRDAVDHTVTAADGSFDVTVAPGATTEFNAPTVAGTYAFVCELHPSMRGSITVK